jgi:hypothetical protein
LRHDGDADVRRDELHRLLSASGEEVDGQHVLVGEVGEVEGVERGDERPLRRDDDGALAVELDRVPVVVGAGVAHERHVGGAVVERAEGGILAHRHEVEPAEPAVAPDAFPLARDDARHERDEQRIGHEPRLRGRPGPRTLDT